ncbi:MAG: hypothetical protein NXH72_15700 [Hyphomonadaceae bacterium]|nr:hypothetical protein [Hyphomonadaceae bacterium]
MREDMFKVIVERPRWGSRHGVRSKLRHDKVPDRKRATGRRMVLEGMGWTKCLNENLAPLKRYLNKQVGRPWNKVYSEISAHLDTSSTVKQHVRDHLTDFILVDVTVARDGSFMASNHWGRPMAPDQWWAKLYVDPNDGLIKRTDKLCRKLGLRSYRDKLRADRKRRAQGERVHNLRGLTETRFLVKLKGCWFQIDCDHAPMDKFGRRLQGRELVEQLGGGRCDETISWRIIAKHQLSKKELKAHKLSND